jgi:GrpB-like predicted nucleotidyltransferase (UPF0157 family)
MADENSASSSGLGLPQGIVLLAEANPAWQQAFDTEAALIRNALGARMLAIEHIGSTAIPRIRAKPVLDIMVGIRNFAEGAALEPAFASIGYNYARHADLPGHHVFGKGIAERTHLVHVVAHEGEVWSRHLKFRDSLRTDPALARDYEALKDRLAVEFASDRPGYTAAKSQFIDAVVSGQHPSPG